MPNHHATSESAPPVRPSSHILSLPPELLLRILSCVADGCPTDLARCRSICKAFWALLEDSGRAVDTSIWKTSAASLMKDLKPAELPDDNSWREFVQRTWRISRPGFRRLEENEKILTSPSGPWPPPPLPPSLDEIGVEPDHDPRLPTTALLPPIPAGARREIDFLHSATEASRIEEEIPYLGVSRDHFVFSDDPRVFSDTPGDIFRLKVLPEAPFIGPCPPDSLEAQNRLEELGNIALVSWLKSQVHSDADLQLHALPVANKAAEITRVTRLSSPNATWDLSKAGGWEGLSLDPTKPLDWNGWNHDFEDVKVTWEFRSAGPYLAVCDDNSGHRESTVSCFSTFNNSNAAPIWQKRMVSPQSADNNSCVFSDNDGLAMTSAFIVYASRCRRSKHARPTLRHPSMVNVEMTFHLLSTSSGDMIRKLQLSQETRDAEDGLYFWCSFSVSDSCLVATVGGHASGRRRFMTERYGYPTVLCWDLTSSSNSPSTAIDFPKHWNPSSDAYTRLSADGRWLGVSVGWEMCVWDLITKKRVGLWGVTEAERYDNEFNQGFELSDRNVSWNGCWIKYRDIMPHGTVHHGMAYLASRSIRRICHGGNLEDAMTDLDGIRDVEDEWEEGIGDIEWELEEEEIDEDDEEDEIDEIDEDDMLERGLWDIPAQYWEGDDWEVWIGAGGSAGGSGAGESVSARSAAGGAAGGAGVSSASSSGGAATQELGFVPLPLSPIGVPLASSPVTQSSRWGTAADVGDMPDMLPVDEDFRAVLEDVYGD